jgi:putative nucleotidyltransferase with HDIG domain
MKDIRTITKDIKELPPLPEVAQKVFSLLNDPNSNVQDLVKVIQLDQAMTANILKLCNSAYFGLKRKISSLQEALVLLGQKKLHEIIMTDNSGKYYEKAGLGYNLEKGEIWKHSMACALLSQILVRKTGLPEDPFLFTAALLHDIGKVILSTYVKAEYNQIIRLVKEQRYPFLQAEKEIIGIDHAELGGRIAEEWNFPGALVEAIARHHTPDTENYISCIVHLCNLMTIMMGIGTGYGLADYGKDDVMKKLGLKERHLESCMVELWYELQKAEDLLKC